ncbi:Putative ribosomal N-acetyltransferase YdaF [Planctomycetes bacterium Pan216]|uniref:Ribosomal N-acetyltransferase YdaF n=1 Tax=Kolteria novifilia TaxID=2527975 RepID=A0A518BAQ9_9BACT|nr:Putative ribosomal N-acetyltransferase YdaF [Planctomycetes bacterium Pan216]
MFPLSLDAETELRPVALGDAEELFALVDRHRGSLRQWLPWLDDCTRLNQTRENLERALEQMEEDQGPHLTIRVRGVIVGRIGFHSIDWTNRRTSLGYWLAPEARGRGIMTRSCRALIDYALVERRLNRVEIRCAEGNRASRAIPERLGFPCEGKLAQAQWLYDHYVDLVVYRMLADEWRAMSPPSQAGVGERPAATVR